MQIFIDGLYTRIEEQKQETQLRFISQQAMINDALTKIQEMLAENTQLKADLAAANELNADLHAKIAELEKQQQSVQQQQQQPPPPMNSEDFLEDDQDLGVSASQHAPKTLAEKAESAARLRSYANAATQKGSDFPPLEAAKRKPARKSAPARRQPPVPATKKAPSQQSIEWATRGFQEATGPEGYDFVYLKSQHRTTHSEVRRRLRILGAAHARVLDIQFPTRGVIGLLVHATYKPTLVELFHKVNINPIANFDPTAASVISDPKLSALSDAAKIKHATEVYQKRMLRTCLYMPQRHLGLAVLNHFHLVSGPHHVDQQQLTLFNTKRPAPSATTSRQRDNDLFVSAPYNEEDEDVDLIGNSSNHNKVSEDVEQ